MPGRPHNTTIGFFDLPDDARKKMYEGVLKLTHPIFLFQDGDTRVETFAPDRPPHWLALLHTSHQMHQEAAAILYSTNVYTMLDADGQGSKLIQGFLRCIGSGHAKTLSHLCITFPTIQRNLGGFQLGPDGAKMIELIRAECSKLEILETHLAGKLAIHLTETDRSVPDFTLEALTDLDRHVRSISSIRRFIVRVYSGRPAAHRMEVMRALGWEVLPANKDECIAAQDLGSSSRGYAIDLFQLDAEPGAAARQGGSESLIFHLTGFPGDVQELSQHGVDVRSTAWSADIWTAAFHEAVEKVGEDIDQAIIKGKDAEQLLKELERLDMDSSQRSAFSRGHEFLKTLQVPLQTFKMGLDLASPFTAIEPTTSVVVGVLRAVTAMAITLAGTKPDLAESVAAMLEQMSYIDDCDTLGQKANRLDIHQLTGGSQAINCDVRLNITPNWENTGPTKLAWAFLQTKDSPAGRTSQILSALTLALLEQLPGLKKTFYDWYKKHQASNNIDPGTDASKLTEFLTGIIGTLERPLYFVIDGLEECDRQSQHGVLELLKALQRNTPTVKSVVSSRPQQEMFAQIGAKYQVYLTPNARRDEIITRYMVTTGLPDLSEDVQTYLMDRLSRMACGSAVWLKMIVDLIACHRISQIGPMKRFFDGGSLPRTLTQLYDTLLSRYALDDAENLNLAKTALKMLAVAYRPLSISELAWAVALAIHGAEVSTIAALNDFVDHQRVLSLISPFVSLIDFGDIRRHQVRVAHQSVKEFIMEHLSPKLTSCDSTSHRLSASNSSQGLNVWAFNICTVYLLLDEVGQSDLFSDELTAIEALPPETDLFQENTKSAECDLSCTWETWEERMICYDPIERGFGGFLVYSSCYWLNHLAETTTELDSCLERVEGICRAGSTRLRNWIQQYRRPGCTIQPRFLFEDELYDPLSITCLFGSESMLWHVLANADFCKDVYHPHSVRRAVEQVLQWGDLARTHMLAALRPELWVQITKAQLSWLVISQWSIQDSGRRDWDAVFNLLRRTGGGLGSGPSAEELRSFALQRNCPPMFQLYDTELRP
ncbi:hypothetical protein KC326_g350 [Hortaea werneckii]|nr:hypothetical protein KC326_g350 [Hortaea werneckii]